MNDQDNIGRRLPIEIIRHILTYLSEEDELNKRTSNLLSVCLTSQTLCKLAAPYLYRTIILNDTRQAQLFFGHFHSSSSIRNRNEVESNPMISLKEYSQFSPLQIYLKHLWCGIMSEVLYDTPHGLLQNIKIPAQEVAWMQSDSDGRYYGFHYYFTKQDDDKHIPFGTINAIHIVCPDLGRWTLPLFCHLENLQFATLSLYPKGNWDLEAAKIERILCGILTNCKRLKSLSILVCHTRAAAGSRTIRMTRSIPVAQAVRAINDDRISVKASDFLFDIYGRSPADEVVQYTRLHWQARVQGECGPWSTMVQNDNCIYAQS